MRRHNPQLMFLLTLVLCFAPAVVNPLLAQDRAAAREALLARAKAVELNTPYVAPPGDPAEHDASGYAKVMCSAVFITKLDPDFAAANIGGFTGSFEERAKLAKPVIDRANKTVTVTASNGVKRVARYVGSQGCVTLPSGKDTLNFKPVRVTSKLPNPSTQPWPMGDVVSKGPLPSEINAAKLNEAVDAAFDPAEGMTAAFIVTHKGRIIAERYRKGITSITPLESWSMG